MSIVIAINECSSCGESNIFSMEETKWYKTNRKSPQLERLKKYSKSDKCFKCITGIREPIYAEVRMARRIEYGIKITRIKKRRVIKRRKKSCC